MIGKNNQFKILREFMVFPRKFFYAREISRETNIALPSVLSYLKKLKKENLILGEKSGLYQRFIANRDNEMFKILKKSYLVLKINDLGLLDYLYEVCLPNSIVLFGSSSKGEDIEESDIDIFVESSEKELNLKKYEKKLNRNINVFFKNNFLLPL